MPVEVIIFSRGVSSTKSQVGYAVL